MPPNTVSVARPGRFGNPARVVLDEMVHTGREDEDGEEILQGPWACLISKPGVAPAGWWFATEAEARAKAVEYFRYLCTKSPGWIAKASDLRGKNVGCWCALDQPCHGDVWLELASQGGEHGG